MNDPLYDANGLILRKIYFQKSLKLAGIEKGDIVFVHSDIGSFGKLLTSDRELLLGSLMDSIKSAVGKSGTIMIPTFSYSIEKKEVFDPDSTKSSVGALTEFFRKQKGVKRTLHPTHSVAVWGKLKDYFAEKSEDTFGTDSVFAKLHMSNGKVVFLGAPFQSLTFTHYIEQMHGVPYRNIVKLKGRIIENKKTKDCNIEYYEKYSYFFTSLAKFENHLIKNRMMKIVHLGSGKIIAVESSRLFEEGTKLLDKDIYFFLRNDGIFRIFNAAVYPFIKYTKPFAKVMDKIFSRIFLNRQL
ncbi:MAG TPA: AAC(3) family N-acetyltransferase [Candidatus Nanoarchaeia archaeon]|nr:AAC(3) family N-acetyltransferase [Candidatus Nanoarchaeia archaeon]